MQASMKTVAQRDSDKVWGTIYRVESNDQSALLVYWYDGEIEAKGDGDDEFVADAKEHLRENVTPGSFDT